MPSGNRSFNCAIRAFTRSATSRAFDPGSNRIASPTDGLPS